MKKQRQQSTIANTYETSYLNSEPISFPFPETTGLPVINTSIGELIYLYFPRAEYNFINIEVKPENRTVFRDTEIIKKLRHNISLFSKKVYKNNNLEKRIQISYSDQVKLIEPNVSIALQMDNKLKNKKFISEKLKNFRGVKSDIIRNTKLNDVRNDDPFADLKQGNGHRKGLLRKVGISLQNESEIEPDISLDYDFEFLEKFNNDEKEKVPKKEKPINYREMIHEIFSKKLNDFRKEIVEYVIDNDNNFEPSNFEKFVFYIEFFIILFSGIRTKYYIDELCYLNLDFYASEKTFMNIAEMFHYQVQFQIMDLPVITSTDKVCATRDGKTIDFKQFNLIKKKLLSAKNKEQPQDYNFNHVENFPPFTTFIKAIANKFRRYDIYDNYHSCPLCENKTDYKGVYKLKCSSCFRVIDKSRLAFSMLSNIMDINSIQKAINSTNDETFNGIFKSLLVLHNQKEIETTLNINSLIKGYVVPISIKETKVLNKSFRDIYGEEIGFYYTWLTHYIKWLMFPAVIGLFLHLCRYLFDTNSFLTLNLLFAAIVVLWGSYYVEAWKGIENLYRYIWGMENYKLEKTTDIIKENSENVRIEHFMGVKIPLYSRIDKFFKNLFSLFIIIINLLFTFTVNLLIFYIEKSKLYEKESSPLFSKLLRRITKGYILYFIPVITYFVREIISIINEKISRWLTEREKSITKDEFINSFLKKQLLFEFFNYYFNLYYIAFGKTYLESCSFDNCFIELGNQLTIIIISNITVIATKVFYNGLYRRNQTKKFEKNILEKYLEDDNSSKKFIYYTRTDFCEGEVSTLILPVVFNFGYVLQFGASSPISFFFVLCLVLFMRVTNGISMTQLLCVKTVNESHGIGLFNSVQGLLAFLGLFTNLCIIFYTNKEFIPLSSSRKLLYLVLTENVVFLILKVFYYAKIPMWFSFKTKIEMKYLKKHGTRPKDLTKSGQS